MQYKIRNEWFHKKVRKKKEKGKKPMGEKITGGCDGLAKFNKNQFPHHWVVIMFKWNILQGHEKDLNYRCIFFL